MVSDEEVLRRNRVGADPGRRFLPRPKGMPGGWPAVVYPALSPGGTVTYVQARYLQAAGRSRQVRQSGSQPRHQPPGGVAAPRRSSRAAGVLVVTEGVADGLVAAQAGFPTVGVLGSQYPDRRVVDSITTTMERSPALAAATVVVCFDGDPSGRAGAERLCGLLAERGIPQRQLSPPDGHDLTDWARAAGATWASGLGARAASPRATSPTVTPASTVPAVPPPTSAMGLGLPGPA